MVLVGAEGTLATLAVSADREFGAEELYDRDDYEDHQDDHMEPEDTTKQ